MTTGFWVEWDSDGRAITIRTADPDRLPPIGPDNLRMEHAGALGWLRLPLGNGYVLTIQQEPKVSQPPG